MDDVELRKVQVSGGSTYILSLPKTWARAQGVKTGDQLAILPLPDGSLSIVPRYARRPEIVPTPFDATKLDGETLLRGLIGAYISGHDALLIRCHPRLSPSQRETIRRFTRICIGPEIIEETGETVLVRDLVNPTEFTLRSALNRIQLMTHSMVQDALSALREHDVETAKDVRARDDEVDRLHRLVAKRFAKMLSGQAGARDPGLTLLEAQHIHQVSRVLERCADHAVNVAVQGEQLSNRTLKPDDLTRILRLGEKSLELLARSFAAFKRGDNKEANRVVDESHQLLLEKGRQIESLLRYGSQHASGLTLLVESLERIHQYAADIAEVTLNGVAPALRGGR